MTGPIRILQVVTHMNRGGLETMLMNYYRCINRDKVQFDFLVHRTERADYDVEIESMGGNIYRLPRLIPWSGTYKHALHSFFDAHPEYRIVHVHQDCLSSVILKAAEQHGVPVRIAHSHSSSQDKDLKYLIKILYKQSIPQYATDLLACGKQAGEWMFGGAPFQILNNAINAAAYRYDAARSQGMRRELSLPKDAFVIGHVGRFSTPKNHSFLLDVFAELHKIEPTSYLLLVGDGILREKMEAKAKALSLEQAVIFLGLRKDVPELLQAMDVFAFPSLYEGLPLTLVEAQAAGLPCVISENIPVDCDMTDLISRVSLDESPVVWAERILAEKVKTRRDTCAEIVAAGFDVAENARWLEKFYIQRWVEQ